MQVRLESGEKTMAISLKSHKILWGRANNQCAICKTELIVDSVDSSDDPSIVGEEAHIIARKESFTRGEYDSLSIEERDHHSNLILLCRTHHKQIDDQPAHFTVERLREIKAVHESQLKSRRTEAEDKKQQEDLTYAGYIDEWQRRADLTNWRAVCCWIDSAATPALPKTWYYAQKEFLIWIIGRIWPKRYPLLEKALRNYKAVLQDFLNVFDRHVDWDREDADFLRTRKLYQAEGLVDQARYWELFRQYEEHVDLVCDLFFELTRAANYVCDHVRNSLFSGYRLSEGALLIERHSVGRKAETILFRTEYRDQERTEMPYPGLTTFKKIRYIRDYAIDPNPSELPMSDDEDV